MRSINDRNRARQGLSRNTHHRPATVLVNVAVRVRMWKCPEVSRPEETAQTDNSKVGATMSELYKAWAAEPLTRGDAVVAFLFAALLCRIYVAWCFYSVAREDADARKSTHN